MECNRISVFAGKKINAELMQPCFVFCRLKLETLFNRVAPKSELFLKMLEIKYH